jgi:hypothetical protein
VHLLLPPDTVCAYLRLTSEVRTVPATFSVWCTRPLSADARAASSATRHSRCPSRAGLGSASTRKYSHRLLSGSIERAAGGRG